MNDLDTTKLRPRKARSIPFGWKEYAPNPKEWLQPDEREIEALKRAIEYHKQNYTYRAIQEWLIKATGRKVSTYGLYKLLNKYYERKKKK